MSQRSLTLSIAILLGWITLILSEHSATAQSTATGKAPSRRAKKALSAEVTEELYQWNQETTVGEYERIGHKNPKWDKDAKAALDLFALSRSHSTNRAEDWTLRGSNFVSRAVEAGCKDPLIRYLHVRWVTLPVETNLNTIATLYGQIAEDIGKTDYAAIRKFYGGLRAYLALAEAAGKSKIGPDGVRLLSLTFDSLKLLSEEPSTPPHEIVEAMDEVISTRQIAYDIRSKVFTTLEPNLVKHWANFEPLHRLRGGFYIDYAWKARGYDYADKVKPENWKLFEDRLEKAEEALNRAWQLDPTDLQVPIKMLRVELGQGKGREQMELWFRRAMSIETNGYDACLSKLSYLEPKWHGSEEELLKFGRECAKSKEWGGSVPLILVEAHRRVASYLEKEDQADYWKNPKIWPELKECFESYFARNPKGIGWRHNYAFFAYKCEQWADLKKQIGLLGPINYSYFGGKAAYETMVRLANEHTQSK